jgi:hypothetical protein
MHGEIDGGEVDELVAQQLSRGWFVGGEGFRNWLAQQLPGRTDNLRGEQRTAHDEVEAESLLQRALAELKVSESELLSMKNNRPEKQAVAWLLKKRRPLRESGLRVGYGWVPERIYPALYLL